MPLATIICVAFLTLAQALAAADSTYEPAYEPTYGHTTYISSCTSSVLIPHSPIPSTSATSGTSQTSSASITPSSLPASCSDLPASSTKICFSLIAQGKFGISTCNQSVSTVTQTSVVTAAASVTTATVTETSIALFTATNTSTSINTATSTVTVVSDTTSTTTVTTTPPPEASICTRAPAVIRRQASPLPAACSCFLNTTSCPTPQTVKVFTTNILPGPTETSTATINTTFPSTILTQIYANATITLTTTTTSTQTSFATSTSYSNFCSTQKLLPGKPSIRHGGVVIGGSSQDNFGGTDPTFCCGECDLNSDCVYYSLDRSGSICYTYSTKRGTPNGSPMNACRSAKCPLGVQDFDNTQDPGSGEVFYAGNCLSDRSGQ